MDSPPEGDTYGAYARDALRNGLEIENSIGSNPYGFGFIGSSDGHNAASPVEEDQYFGKMGVNDGSPQARGSVPLGDSTQAVNPNALEFGASGLAGVWAEENSRASIFAALRRKETFATSGPRIQLRFFAGFGYPDDIIESHDPDIKGIRRRGSDGWRVGSRAELAAWLCDLGTAAGPLAKPGCRERRLLRGGWKQANLMSRSLMLPARMG